jgi:hypothetical protein
MGYAAKAVEGHRVTRYCNYAEIGKFCRLFGAVLANVPDFSCYAICLIIRIGNINPNVPLPTAEPSGLGRCGQALSRKRRAGSRGSAS